MNIVAISTLSPHHQFVLARIHERWPLRAVVQPVWKARTAVAEKFAKLLGSPLKTFGRGLNTSFYRRQARRLDRRIAQALYDSAIAPPFDVPCQIIPNNDINSDQSASFIRQLDADVIITSGCPLLKPKIFNLPCLATLNVHWGIAPQYRGSNTLFWPLYYGDYQNLGVTIHRINEGIDTGPILAHGFPELTDQEDEASLFAKCAPLASDLMIDVLATIEATRNVPDFTSSVSGRLFLHRDRSVHHDVVYWARRFVCRCNSSSIQSRRLTYFGEQESGSQLADSNLSTETTHTDVRRR